MLALVSDVLSACCDGSMPDGVQLLATMEGLVIAHCALVSASQRAGLVSLSSYSQVRVLGFGCYRVRQFGWAEA